MAINDTETIYITVRNANTNERDHVTLKGVPVPNVMEVLGAAYGDKLSQNKRVRSKGGSDESSSSKS